MQWGIFLHFGLHNKSHKVHDTVSNIIKSSPNVTSRGETFLEATGPGLEICHRSQILSFYSDLPLNVLGNGCFRYPDALCRICWDRHEPGKKDKIVCKSETAVEFSVFQQEKDLWERQLPFCYTNTTEGIKFSNHQKIIEYSLPRLKCIIAESVLWPK